MKLELIFLENSSGNEQGGSTEELLVKYGAAAI